MAVDAVFGPMVRGAAAALGKLVDWLGSPMADPSCAPKGGTFLMRCGLLFRRGQGSTHPHPGGGLRAQALGEWHDGPLGGHFGRAKTGWGGWCGASWRGIDVDVGEYVP